MKDFLGILSDQHDEVRAINPSVWISRKLKEQIDLDSPLAQIVIGVRRSGKSTLCLKRLIESRLNFAYVNFDDERLYKLKSDELNEALSALYRIYGDFSHLFMDEVQNVEGYHNLTLIIGKGNTTEIKEGNESINVCRASDWL